MPKLRIGIIGGGWSGIYMAKHCLETGLKPTVFESSDTIGGQWVYQEHASGGVKKNTITVSSKTYMSPVDFPYSEDDPEFLEAETVYQHFLKYVAHFKLNNHIKYNQHVIQCYKDKKEWVIETQKGEFRFDKIVIATGMNQTPRYPTDAMYQNFKGQIYHSHDLKVLGNRFDKKKVLIIGGSDTASDLACELSQVCDVTVSMRHGTWFQDRLVDELYPEMKGYPADMAYSRFMDRVFKTTNHEILKFNGFIKTVEDGWGICGSGIPEWYSPAGYLNTYYTKSRDLAVFAREGKVTPRRGVSGIDGNFVYFDNDSEPHYFDTIIFCTGYKPNLNFKFPYRPEESHYRKILSTNDPSVAFIGYARPYLTSITMLVEMQTRWLANLFAGNQRVPSEQEMKLRIEKDEQYRKKRFPLYADRMPFLVDPYHYMDTLAKDIGAYPNFIKLFFTSPRLAYHLYMDSWHHYAYRIHDPAPEKRAIALAEVKKLKTNELSKVIRNAPFNGLKGIILHIWNWRRYLTQRTSFASTSNTMFARERKTPSSSSNKSSKDDSPEGSPDKSSPKPIINLFHYQTNKNHPEAQSLIHRPCASVKHV